MAMTRVRLLVAAVSLLAAVAFATTEHIMRDVNWGWMMRYAHANGASFFFIVVYLHIFRGFFYSSYKAPREMIWLLGVVIFLLMMATAFMGYVLPWGQMSFWGAKVITGLFGAIPLVGEPIQVWLLGGFAPDNAALNRFFSLHFLLPFVIAGVVILHIWALHIPGSSNPTGVEVKQESDTLPFHPYYTVKDGFAIIVFLMIRLLPGDAVDLIIKSAPFMENTEEMRASVARDLGHGRGDDGVVRQALGQHAAHGRDHHRHGSPDNPGDSLLRPPTARRHCPHAPTRGSPSAGSR